ncbi:unnamed protein product [Rhizophagus irregularis]|uniref:DDE-1 domain-containing protein n=1 Tax=Rhizophagus irregularis TaxID=588596 RepID=A0A915Z739_9GLOM|nr:unnamed protein product [Rhizophagus irregularis]CAB5363561.1 unnamed protein product [Rhizophagus irregularis]
MELNIPVPKLKISDSISLCAKAWEAVTSETIRNCWSKTGILPISPSPSPSPLPLPSPSDEEQNDDGLNEIEEIQKLLDQYSNFISGGLMSAREFILIDDDNNYGGEEITDEEIVNMVKPNETDLEEEELILQPKISTSEALASLDKVLSFLDNPPDTFIMEFNNRNILYNLKKQIIRFNKNSRVQSVLDSWLNI